MPRQGALERLLPIQHSDSWTIGNGRTWPEAARLLSSAEPKKQTFSLIVLRWVADVRPPHLTGLLPYRMRTFADWALWSMQMVDEQASRPVASARQVI
jgi:hypothetical protein